MIPVLVALCMGITMALLVGHMVKQSEDLKQCRAQLQQAAKASHRIRVVRRKPERVDNGW